LLCGDVGVCYYYINSLQWQLLLIESLAGKIDCSHNSVKRVNIQTNSMVRGYAAAATALLALSGVNSFGKCTLLCLYENQVDKIFVLMVFDRYMLLQGVSRN